MSGDYSTSATLYVDYKNTFNLSGATGAFLSFWVKHRAENCNDKLQIQISTDGGSLFTPICDRNTVAENSGSLSGKPALTGIRENWTKELFDLSSFLGNASVRLQFEFTSNTDNAADDFYKKVDDGFYLDNVKLVKTSAVLTTLPVTFINFNGKLLPDNIIQLHWEAYTDQQHNYFEVQRSGDRSNFLNIGKGNAFPPFDFLDKQPKPGNNFYQVKQVDKDGTITYSSIINITILNNVNVIVFPNPVNDKISIKLASINAEIFKLQITDMKGKVIYTKLTQVRNGAAELNVDMKSWSPQTYILKIIGRDGISVVTQKLIKL